MFTQKKMIYVFTSIEDVCGHFHAYKLQLKIISVLHSQLRPKGISQADVKSFKQLVATNHQVVIQCHVEAVVFEACWVLDVTQS